ncbi:hypothetical protein [Bdellovibrio sp. ZAP7]|uniref:hypothetical protein n=1 Tax=Bdellovibrio sp. ZAP7 TaxID=2231053 RepID=UPI00143D8653|nr:hypothetical protein [Bdellovibrio sp. ZAP7]
MAMLLKFIFSLLMMFGGAVAVAQSEKQAPTKTLVILFVNSGNALMSKDDMARVVRAF